jgi:hypothetical protein
MGLSPRNRSLGHAEVFDGFGSVEVIETLTCCHCGKLYRKPDPGEPSGFCRMCFSPVCLACGKIDKCDPFEEKLKRMEARARLLDAVT